MNIEIVTPGWGSPATGNSVTARRYAQILSRLGHRISVLESYSGEICDALIALHARRSYDSIRKFRAANPAGRLILVLTGTDLYRDIRFDRDARRALKTATRLVVLQQAGLREIPSPFQPKTAVIYQSAKGSRRATRGPRDGFQVCTIANLRPEKDPLRTAVAVRRLPLESQIRLVHIGRALDPKLEARAVREMHQNPRYDWVGEQIHRRTRQILADSQILAVTSHIEGGSNALSEALASSVPVIASRIPGLQGTLGDQYPGFFPPGNTRSLARLLLRAESDPRFYSELASWCRRIKPLVSPAREMKSWKDLLDSL
jgi:putative glycosyltransferase (TIGR04348 family)